MAQLDVNFDYLEILELEPAEALHLGRDVLRARINQKKKEWTAKELVPLYQQEARRTKERLREFEELLAEPDALVAYVRHIQGLRVEKRRQQEEELRRLVALAAADRREISPRQRDLLLSEARAQKIPEAMLDALLKSLGTAVRDPAAAVRPVIPRLTPALDRVVLTEINNWLKILDKPSLYAVLDLPRTSAPAQLEAAAKHLYAKWSKVLPKTCWCTAWEKTLQACLTYLKQADSKERYDHALINQRIDQFLQRVDLVLAGTRVGKQEQAVLLRLGVEEFGLGEKLARECLLARAAEGNIALEPAKITIQLQGQIQCPICFAWNDAHLVRANTEPLPKHCRHCGGTLHRTCLNPACRAALPGQTKVCPQCRLPFARGQEYVSLLEVADTSLSRGSVQAALQACESAGQILPGQEIERRLARAHKIRLGVASVRGHVARKAWSWVLHELQQLLELAPGLRQPDLPTLESVTDYVVGARQKLHDLATNVDPSEAARLCLDWLAQWTDFEEAYQRLVGLGMRWENDGNSRDAWQLVQKLVELRPDDPDLKAWVVRLEAEKRSRHTTPDPPEAPRHLSVTLDGPRRLLAWEPASPGKPPTAYVLQRGVTRPGGQPDAPDYQTLYEGPALQYTDGDKFLSGAVLSYRVRAVLRGQIAFDGRLPREYEVASEPTAAAAVLLWQEVLNLRCSRRNQALHLAWYKPAAARQVVVERWPGGPAEPAAERVSLTPTANNALLDVGVGEGLLYTYRVACVYDGPDGPFTTPGLLCTETLPPANGTADSKALLTLP